MHHLPPPAITGYVDYHGHRIPYIRRDPPGSEGVTPIILVHGLTGSVRFWEAGFPEPLRSNFPWHSIGLPLHAPATLPTDPDQLDLSEQDYAELLLAVIDHLAPGRPVHLLGYSLGGFAVLNLAARHPERVKSVVSISGFTTGRVQGLRDFMGFLAQDGPGRKTLFHLGWRFLHLHPLCYRCALYLDAADWSALTKYGYLGETIRNMWPDIRRHRVAAFRRLFRALLTMDIGPEISRITAPTLIIVGADDPTIPISHHREYAAAIPGARFTALAGAGHIPFAERPEEFNRILWEWYESETSDV